MYSATTHYIVITVEPHYLDEESEPVGGGLCLLGHWKWAANLLTNLL